MNQQNGCQPNHKYAHVVQRLLVQNKCIGAEWEVDVVGLDYDHLVMLGLLWVVYSFLLLGEPQPPRGFQLAFIVAHRS